MPTWSGMKKKLENDYLADSLKNRVSYFATSYSYSPDHIGRAAIRLDGIEIFKSDYFKMQKLQWESYQNIIEQTNDSEGMEEWKESWLQAVEKGGFDNRFFYTAFEEYDNQSIELSLTSRNALVRVFAVMDRRVGKRRLENLADAWKDEPDWIKYFLNLRLEAEGLLL